MSVGSISIHTEYARLERHTILPSVSMNQQHVQVNIESELPRVTIDQTECFNSAGLKTSSALMETAVSEGKSNSLQYIETSATDGKMFAGFENGMDTRAIIANIAIRNTSQEREFNVVSMPTARPKIDVTGGSLDINFYPKELGQFNGVQFDVRLGSMETRYVPGSVNIDYRV